MKNDKDQWRREYRTARLATREIMQPLRQSLSHLYGVFSMYEYPGDGFCPHCYSEEEIHQLTSDDVQSLGPSFGRKLLWETADHFGSADVYKHFLPRAFQSLAPPESEKPKYPRHPFEVLHHFGCHAWPETERQAVVSFLDVVTAFVEFWDDSDYQEWRIALDKLRAGTAEV